MVLNRTEYGVLVPVLDGDDVTIGVPAVENRGVDDSHTPTAAGSTEAAKSVLVGFLALVLLQEQRAAPVRWWRDGGVKGQGAPHRVSFAKHRISRHKHGR